MGATLKFVQLNIERSKHLGVVVPFLKHQNPDVVTLQEVMERDVQLFERELGMKAVYARMCMHPAEGSRGVMGNAILTKLPIQKSETIYYHQSDNPIVEHIEGIPGTTANAVTIGDIKKEGEIFRIAATHFTVALNGGTNELQTEHLQKMLAILDTQGEFVLAGDFNAPRGKEIYSVLAAKYKDNIPVKYTTSIDSSIHRAGEEKLRASARAQGLEGLMVEGLFSTPAYKVSNVMMHTGLSDHCAFSAEISKA